MGRARRSGEFANAEDPIRPRELAQARGLRRNTTGAALIDEALSALVSRYRSGEIDAAYDAYDDHPTDEPDEWGDLASFREAAAKS